MSDRFLAAASDASPRADSPPRVGGSPPERPGFASRFAASASESASGGVGALAARLAAMTGSSTPVATLPSVAPPPPTVSSSGVPEIQAGGELHLVIVLLVICVDGVPGGWSPSVWVRLPASGVPFDNMSGVVIILSSSDGHWMPRVQQMLGVTTSTGGPSVLHWVQHARRLFSSSPLQPHLAAWEEFSSEWPAVSGRIFGLRGLPRVWNTFSLQGHAQSPAWNQFSLIMGSGISPAYLLAIHRRYGGSVLRSDARRYRYLLARMVQRPWTIHTDSTPVRVYLSRMMATIPRVGNVDSRFNYNEHPMAAERMGMFTFLHRTPHMVEERPQMFPRQWKRIRAWMVDSDVGELFLCHTIEF